MPQVKRWNAALGADAFDLGPGDRLDLPAGTRHAIDVVGLAPVVFVTGSPDRSLITARP